jgi:16S rRNA (uracil1498-N3)-methyltransferase
VAVTLAQAVLKGEKMDGVVRDAAMMGVAAIQPLVTTRTEISVASLGKGKRRERWQRIAVSSAKQCGRAVVPTVLEPAPFESLSEIRLPSPVFMLAEPGVRAGIPLQDVTETRPDQATIIVGPEGGWTREEVEAGTAVGVLVTLGGRTLRADAMALVALSSMFTRWREL